MMKLLIVLALLPVPAAATADPGSPPGAATAAPARAPADPNQIICRRYREIGSRLNVRRDCMTRAAWDEHDRLTRQGVDHAQTTRVISPM
jgi:hypothetical protein